MQPGQNIGILHFDYFSDGGPPSHSQSLFKLELGNSKLEHGNSKLELGNSKLELGNSKLETR